MNAEVDRDINEIRRLVEAGPNLDQLPPGFTVGDALAEQMRLSAESALSTGFNRLAAEGRGASHGYLKVAAEEFAAAVVVLSADRSSRIAAAAALRRSPLERLGAWWRKMRPKTTASDLLPEEAAASLRANAQTALSEAFPTSETLTRPQSFEAYDAAAKYFALGVQRLCLDRAARIAAAGGSSSVSQARAERPSFYDGLRPKISARPTPERPTE